MQEEGQCETDLFELLLYIKVGKSVKNKLMAVTVWPSERRSTIYFYYLEWSDAVHSRIQF